MRLQSRAGRDVTSWWPDLAAPAMKFSPGTVVGGEAASTSAQRSPAAQPHRPGPGVDGRTALSQALTALLAAAISEHLARSGPAHRNHTSAGDAYSTVREGMVVEVLAETTRHAVVTVTRLR
ncbi:hypothetical protein [Streptomyces sp. NPDC058545]|uniref:hypothetical protein n=1 Tax=Streptomyces sp. NPDC058545 TaxID=3346544 RepID=UPI0036610740